MHKKTLTKEFSEEEEVIFQNFFKIKEKRKFAKALEILDSLAINHKDSKVINGLYGSIYYDLNDFKNSTKSFSKVIILNPNSELASLGLFQSLVHLGKARKALKELFRFTENNEPKLYLVTIKELVEEDNIKNIKFKIDKKKIENLFKKWCSLP